MLREGMKISSDDKVFDAIKKKRKLFSHSIEFPSPSPLIKVEIFRLISLSFDLGGISGGYKKV
jgi:hypothetical protein